MSMKSLVIIVSFVFVLTNITITNSLSTLEFEKDHVVVLVTGFGPFLKYDINPSELIAKELDGEMINDAAIIGLPVQVNLSNFSESIEVVYQAIEQYTPDYVFSIGLNPSSKKIEIEKIGYNLKNENSSLKKIIPDGRLLYISPFPVWKIVRELRKNGIPSQTSIYGGFSLCNGLLYSLLYYIDTNGYDIKAGFIHVPLHKSDENPNGMELQTMVNATKIIISVCLDGFD